MDAALQSQLSIAALVCSVLIVYVIRRRRGGGLVSPGAHDPRGGRRF